MQMPLAEESSNTLGPGSTHSWEPDVILCVAGALQRQTKMWVITEHEAFAVQV